jgi:dihydrofolate reductase
MGRVTYDSIVAALGRPLPDRASIVVTRAGQPAGSRAAELPGPQAAPVPDSTVAQPSGSASPGAAGKAPPEGQVFWADSVESALGLAERIAKAAGETEVFVAGGVSIYREVLPVADRIYLTRVHHVVPGDRSMPPGWLAGFDLVRREDAADEKSHLRYSFLDYERAAR